MLGKGGSSSSKTTFQKLLESIGLTTDAMTGSDTGAASQISLLKRINDYLSQLILRQPLPTSNTFNLTTTGQDVQLAVSTGHKTVSVSIAAGSINGTLNLQYSNDDGTSWFNLNNHH